jgi:cell division initiation protein
MPDQSSAATEHAILQEITAPLAGLPDDPVSITHADFPAALRGYDRMAVDAYVKQVSQLVAELQATRSPEAAVRRALERVGEQISGILQRAHDTAEQITSQSRAEAEDRLEQARQEAAQIAADAEQRVKDLDADTDRIWAERHRIVGDTRELAGQLAGLADSAAERFPPADDPEGQAVPYDDQAPEDDQAHDSYQAPEDDQAHDSYQAPEDDQAHDSYQAPEDDQAHDSYQAAPEDDQAHDSYQAREDDEGDATVAFAAVESGSDDEPGAELAYEDAAAEPDYGDAATQPNYGNAATQRDAAADLAYEDAAAGLDSGGAAGTPPPVAADERPGEHDSTAVIPPASQAAHRRAGS